ncbi:MAG TPA: hypothetical protein VK968_12980 [Roseimicrobium sp.]|nr:hypothetical protein [Roseimicrobium sp.]
MSTFSKFLTLAAAACVAFVGSASAQLQTYQTVSSYAGVVVPFGGGATSGQTFTNVSAVKAMTYNFFSNGSQLTNTTLSATFGEWTGSAFVGGTTVSFGSINVPATTVTGVGGWNPLGSFSTYEHTFDLATLIGSYPSLINATYGYLTSSTSTYALMLTNAGGASNVGLGLIFGNPFAYGEASGISGSDWAFSQISVAPGNQELVPVPESSTVALISVGAMVFGLVGYRTYQRRRAAAAPVVAA